MTQITQLIPQGILEHKRYMKAMFTYFGFFASRYVGNDIQVSCGNLLDTPIVKTFTLWCLMYQASDDFHVATIMTCAFLLLQYVMSNSDSCKAYVDKTSSSQLNTKGVIWPVNNDPDATL